jgi:hypothetical protein
MLVVTVALLLFWLRDRSVLRMGSPRKVVHHAWIYSLFVLLGAMAVWILAVTDDSLAHAVTSAPFLIAMAALQVVATVAALSIKRSERYDLAWLIALIPAPWLWILCARSVAGWAYWVVAALWVASMLLDVVRARRIQMPADELDFAVNLAGWSNWIGIGLVALAGSAYLI